MEARIKCLIFTERGAEEKEEAERTNPSRSETRMEEYLDVARDTGMPHGHRSPSSNGRVRPGLYLTVLIYTVVTELLVNPPLRENMIPASGTAGQK